MTATVFADPTVTIDPVVELVGDGKKFATVTDLAKGKLEADKFIDNLKTEMAALRAQLEGQDKLEDLKRELKELKERTVPAAPPTGVVMSEADIKALVTKAITDDEASRTANQNIQEANTLMVQKFGSLDKATEVLQSRAKELGLSVKTLQGIAQQSPTAFVQMVTGKAEETKQGETFVRGTQRTESGFVPPNAQAPKEGTWEYFENIKKTKGIGIYFQPHIQNALHKAVASGTCILPG